MNELVLKEDVLRILKEKQDRHKEHMEDCGPEETRRYYSNQTAVITIEDVMDEIKKL